MIGMTVIGTACLAGLSALLMCLRTSDSTLLALQAATVVRSVTEQLQSLDYQSLFSEQLAVDVPSHPGGSLTVNTWNSRTDDFHHTPNNPRDDLQLKLRPAVTHVTQTDGLDCAQVVIEYEWSDSSFFAPRTHSDSYTLLLAPVSSF